MAETLSQLSLDTSSPSDGGVAKLRGRASSPASSPSSPPASSEISAVTPALAKKPMVKPFIKWAGGKGRLLDQLLPLLPKSFDRYCEPFIGGGAMLFALQPEDAIISDMSAELINCYRVVRDDVEGLMKQLQGMKHSKRKFYEIRSADRRSDYWTLSPAERAARFIYLNKTCFNGLYRVNSRGEFNVPFGSYKKPTICDEAGLRACSKALQGVQIERGSFERVLEWARSGDFVYFDPPYVPLSETSSFTAYDREGFTTEDQIRLRDLFKELHTRGVFCMLSNSSSELIRNLYQDFTISEVMAPRAINAQAGGRGKIAELVVTNY